MTEGPSLSLAEHAILAMLSERPAHGFAIARLTAPGGELGQIWHIPRPVVYRSLGRLLDAGLITPTAIESGRGPQRTIYTATAQGRQAAARWLDTPVEHIRDVRTQLLLKLALLDRARRDPTDLLRQQRAVLEPIAAAIKAERPQGKGFDATLLAWATAAAWAAAIACRAFLRRCSGWRRPLAAAAASRVSSPARARSRPAALPARTAGSKTRREVNAAARSLRVSCPSSDWRRSRPKASQ